LGTGPHFIWARCHTREAAITARLRAHDEEQQAQHEEQARTAYARRVRHSGLGALNGMTLQTFHRSWLTPSPDGTHPLDVVTAWLRDVVDYGGSANYRDVHSPPACLYLHSRGKGRGKTHLAAALGWWALEHGQMVAWVDELGYTRRRSALPFEQIEALVSYPADAAWLTIIDGLGEREDPPASVANAWHELINPRWLRGGWMVITSNDTPDELVRNGTIGDATYSRLQQMTAGYVVACVGRDARLRTAEETAYGTD
jgi:predicted ATPase